VDYYCIPNLFDKDELKIIDKVINNDQWDIAGVGAGAQSARSTKIKWITNVILNEKLLRAFEDANEHYNFIITELYDVGILKYDVGDYYKKHIDIGGPVDIKTKFLSRKLSLITQLSSNYEGGDTFLYTNDIPTTMKKEYNTATIFPSYVLHEVTTIEKGTRYSLVAWACGDPFK